MKLIPIEDRIIVKLDEAPGRSTGGLHLPESYRRQAQKTGVVVAAGPGRYTDDGTLIPMSIKVGDRVLLGRRSDTEEVEHDGAKCLLLREAHVMAVIDPKTVPPPVAEEPKPAKP